MLKNQTVELLPARTTMRHHKASMPSVTVNILFVAHNIFLIQNSTNYFALKG